MNDGERVQGAPLKFEILRSGAKIAALTQEASELLEGRPVTANPRFFLATLGDRDWIPRVVVARRGTAIEAIVYLKERKVAGIATGLLYGHAALGTLVVATPEMADSALDQAIEFLRKKIFILGIRVRVRPGMTLSLERTAANLNMGFSRRDEEYHRYLTLPAAYEQIFDRLSRKSRSNMRYFRRRYEAGGHAFIERLELDDFRQIALQIMKREVTGGLKASVDRSTGVFSEVEHPLLCGLRRKDGEWVAIAGGWRDGDSAVLFFQLNNNRDYPHDSLAVVLRGYFVEALIKQGCGQVYFWAGVTGPIRGATLPFLSEVACLDSGSLQWRLLRSLCRKAAPYLPLRTRAAITWAMPSGPMQSGPDPARTPDAA